MAALGELFVALHAKGPLKSLQTLLAPYDPQVRRDAQAA
jgi:hypothetical protein